MQWTADDITAFLDALGQSAALDDGTAEGLAVTGIFRRPFAMASVEGASIESSGPSFRVASSVAEASAAHGTRIVTGGTTFYIVGIEPTGTGFTNLILSEDP